MLSAVPLLALALTTRKAGAPHLYNVWIASPFVVYLLDAIGLANIPNGTLWETAGRILCFYLACTVATLIQNLMHREFLVSADRRATARTTTSLSHAAIREKNFETGREKIAL